MVHPTATHEWDVHTHNTPFKIVLQVYNLHYTCTTGVHE